MKTFVLRMIVIALGVAQLRGDEGESWQVRAEWMVVSIPTEFALRLIPILRNRKTVSRGVREITGLIASGKGTFHGQPIAWARDGERGTTESVTEVRSPTEFFGGPGPQNLTKEMITAPPPPRVFPPHPGVDVPFDFETRNTGLTLEIEPKISKGGKTITVNLAAKHVMLEQWRRLLISPNDPKGGVHEQPQFRAFTTTTSVELASGEWMLLGTFAVSNPAPQMELFLLRATALPIQP